MAEIDYVQEGANLDIDQRYTGAVSDGMYCIERAYGYMDKHQYSKALDQVKKAKILFRKGITDIRNIPSPISSNIISSYFSSTLGTYRVFKAVEALKDYDQEAIKDLLSLQVTHKLELIGMAAGFTISIATITPYALGKVPLVIPAIGGATGTGIVVKSSNDFNNHRVKSKSVQSTNKFRQDVAVILEAYIKVCDSIIQDLETKVRKKRPIKESYSTEDCEVNDLMGDEYIAQEGANLKINSAYKSIMKESKQNFIDGMNAYQAKDYPKAKELITRAKNSFEKGYWSIYDADKPAEGKTTPMAAGMFTGNIASGTLGVYRTLKENKIFKKYFPNIKFDINDAAERKIVQAATLGLQQDNSKAPYATLNDFKRDMSLIVNAYKNACEYVLKDIDKKMGRQKPATESFYMEDDEMNDNLSMYDLIKLESTLAYYEKREEAMEGTNAKLTFGYAKAMKDGRDFLREAKNLLSVKNYKGARDNVFKARKCFVAVYHEVNDLPESKFSSSIGRIMSAIIGTGRIIEAANELSDFKGSKWTAKLRDVSAVRQILHASIAGTSSVMNASVYERQRSALPSDAKYTTNIYKRDILMVIKAYIEVCEMMMKDIGSTHSAAKESAAAIEEYYTDMLHMGAVMEGKNLDVNRIFIDSITAGRKEIEKSLMYMRNTRYAEAEDHLNTATDKFETAITEIHNIDSGILADTLIGGIMKDFAGTYQLLISAGTIKEFGIAGKDWGHVFTTRAFLRIASFILAPVLGVGLGLNFANIGLNISRRRANTKAELDRGQKKKFTFNGFKEDCIYMLNAYIEVCNDLIDKLKEAQKDNLAINQSDILG